MDTTSISLLERVRQPSDQEAWSRFANLYTPLLLAWVRRTGATQQEAEDLTQEVFAALLKKMPEFAYDKDKSFRGWLRTVAINKWREFKRRRQVAAQPLQEGRDEGMLADPAEQFWEEEYREHLMRRALELMQTDFPEKSWRACWQIMVEGKSAAEVAAEQGTTVGAVHAAKFRILTRLRQELAGMMD
jgi:RNA polymerase sigma-70 factor, ECF subfamily